MWHVSCPGALGLLRFLVACVCAFHSHREGGGNCDAHGTGRGGHTTTDTWGALSTEAAQETEPDVTPGPSSTQV